MTIQFNYLRSLFLTLSVLAYSSGAIAQAPYFDLATFKEIMEEAKDPEPNQIIPDVPPEKIYYETDENGDPVAVTDLPALAPKEVQSVDGGQEERIARAEARLRDFFTSTSFAFNDQITHSILRNAELYIGAFRDIKRKFQIGHANYSQLTDTKFRLDMVPNINFLRALMRVHVAALKDIEESASKVLDVMAYANRDESSYAAIAYHHCIQAMAVSANQLNCVRNANIQLSKDTAAIAKFERAYMMTFRISRLAFAQFHPEVKLQGNPNIISTPVRTNFTIVKDPRMMQYYKESAMTEEQFAQSRFFKKSQLNQYAECRAVTKVLDAIHAIFKSQENCTLGLVNYFGFLLSGGQQRCTNQQFEGNRRKVIVPTIGTEFASLFFVQEKRRSRESGLSDYMSSQLRPACAKTPEHYEFDELDARD